MHTAKTKNRRPRSLIFTDNKESSNNQKARSAKLKKRKKGKIQYPKQTRDENEGSRKKNEDGG